MIEPKIIKQYKILFLCLILCIGAIGSVYAQQKIRIQGVVIAIPGSKPIKNVNIVHNGSSVGSTDVDGKFMITVPRDAKLLFYQGNYNELNINVDGRQQISVAMTERIIEIKQVVVTGKGPKKKITVEPTDIEIRGNYIHIKTKFRIPTRIFTTDYRFIIQPTVYNVTKKTRQNLRPVVIDGAKYTIVQHRYLGFNDNNDKLAPYVVKNDITKVENVYPYADSLYFDRKNLDNDYRSDCYLTLVGYRAPSDYLDSVTIAKGLQNVLRFFKYELPPMYLDNTFFIPDSIRIKNLIKVDNTLAKVDSTLVAKADSTSVTKADSTIIAKVKEIPQGRLNAIIITKVDSAFIPKPELKLMSDKGSTEIEFEVGKSTINYKNPTNQRNINEILNVLNGVQNNENATLKSIIMIGYSSPEGNYTRNKQLADKRTKELFNIVTKPLSTEILKYMTLNSSGMVQPWSEVVKLVEQDSLPVAKKLRDIITKTNDKFTSAQWAIMRLPEYRKIIVPTYLPKMRKVEYIIEYSVFRDVTDEEIRELYEQGEELSRYEYFKLILAEDDIEAREKIEDDAIKKFNNFTWVINRVAIRLLSQGKHDIELQKPVLESAPMSMVYNQAIMALMEKNVLMADSLIGTINTHPETAELSSIVNALSGHYADAYPLIASRGGLNKILLLLCLKYNDQAYDEMKVFMQEPKNMKNAKAWYIFSLCANRQEDLGPAIMYMTAALELDPSLGEIAALDSDVMDIYSIVKPKKPVKSTKPTKSKDE